MDTNIAGAGGSGTGRSQERAVLVRNSAEVGGCGFKNTVPCRALLQKNEILVGVNILGNKAHSDSENVLISVS